jgi:hypothetical protein
MKDSMEQFSFQLNGSLPTALIYTMSMKLAA